MKRGFVFRPNGNTFLNTTFNVAVLGFSGNNRVTRLDYYLYANQLLFVVIQYG